LLNILLLCVARIMESQVSDSVSFLVVI
jgi:hypothetical protein